MLFFLLLQTLSCVCPDHCRRDHSRCDHPDDDGDEDANSASLLNSEGDMSGGKKVEFMAGYYLCHY